MAGYLSSRKSKKTQITIAFHVMDISNKSFVCFQFSRSVIGTDSLEGKPAKLFEKKNIVYKLYSVGFICHFNHSSLLRNY